MGLLKTIALKSSTRLTSNLYWFAAGIDASQLKASPNIGGVILGMKKPTTEEIIPCVLSSSNP